MDLETENKIAAMLLKEAAELRQQAEQDGALAYLRRPNVRARPNSRFLTATVLGVQQANKAVEVNEMWRARQKELELDSRHKGRSRNGNADHDCSRDLSRSTSKRINSNERSTDASCSSSQRVNEDCYSQEQGGLRDEEVEEFLRSRAKRGRGSIGSRIDEPGPYLPHLSAPQDVMLLGSDDQEKEQRQRRALGPEKPSYLKSYESSEDEHDDRKRSKKSSSKSSKKNYKKHKSKEKSRDGNKKKREKKYKH